LTLGVNAKKAVKQGVGQPTLTFPVETTSIP
jgi:hypothetical protein